MKLFLTNVCMHDMYGLLAKCLMYIFFVLRKYYLDMDINGHTTQYSEKKNIIHSTGHQSRLNRKEVMQQ